MRTVATISRAGRWHVSCQGGGGYIAYNGLTGTLPTELGMLSEVYSLELDQNSLTGTVPTELGMLSEVYRLYMSKNSLTGTVPTELGMLSEVHHLLLNDNMLEGSLPSQLGALTNGIEFQYNADICGTISFDIADDSWRTLGTAIGQHCNASGA
ncbi:hypothetical protein CYMTET_17643 [Cymbomonas tetramitiformis]|uniref:L domain-like protein n=1 Tax=Cymbomonas tetramitiformis TaxID=36881 RepID=A0AAE0L6S3_9CHLO|nr:hypothetical protein CYMTET_17643 [Cymbomonas tetramitiformis]